MVDDCEPKVDPVQTGSVKVKNFASRLQSKTLAIFSLLLFTVLAFQNCSPRTSLLQFSGSSNKISGNGGGYEGKLSYYRFVPDMMCAGQESYKEMLVFDQKLIWLYENTASTNTCQQSKTLLEQKDIGISPFQNEFLVVHDYLYAKYDFSTQTIPNLLAESLCRDNWENPNLEIANHYNYRTGEATTRVFSRSSDGAKLEVQSDTSTSRLLTPFDVNYQAFNQRLKFTINLKQGTGLYSRLYSGAITSVDPSLSSVLKPLPVKCVTGGGIDSSIWPLRKVNVSPTISDFYVHPTENDIYFKDRNPDQLNWWRPFVMKNESTVINISESIFKTSMYVVENNPIKNSQWMMLEGVETNGTPYFGRNVYIYRPDDPSTLRTLVRAQSVDSFIPNQDIVSSSIMQLSEFEFGYWITNQIYSAEDQTKQETQFYRILNWKTLETKDYLKASPASGIANSLYFKDSPWPTGLVGNLHTRQDGKFELFYFNIRDRIESIHLLPDVPFCSPVQGSSLEEVERFFISQNSQVAIIEYRCTNSSRKILGISLKTGIYYLAEGSKTLLWKSKDGETFMSAENSPSSAGRYPFYNPQKIQIVQSSTGQSEPSQLDPHSNSQDQNQFNVIQKMYSGPGTGIKAYSKNGQKYMAAFTAGTAWNVRLKNLYTHTESTVCKNALGEKIDLLNFSEDQLVLVTFKPGQRIFIYEVTESKTCKLLNSAPVKYTAIRALAPTKSGLGVATAVATRGDVYSYNDVADDVFFINKDGRAPLYINLNTADFGTIISLQVSQDQTKLYILGTGLQEYIQRTLFWLRL